MSNEHTRHVSPRVGAARERHVPRGLPMHPIRGPRRGHEIWDTAGKEYLDFTSGIGVLNTGHRHPHVVAAVRAARSPDAHLPGDDYEPHVELVAKLARWSAARKARGVLFATGAEAIENAVKIARAHTNVSHCVQRDSTDARCGIDDDRVEPVVPPELRPVRR